MKRRPSIWRTQLTREDWDFPNWSDNQLPGAHDWEFQREKWQRVNGGQWPAVNVVELPSADDLRRARFFEEPQPKRPFSHWHPKFPKTPYAKARPEVAIATMTQSEYSMLERSWPDLLRYYSSRVEAILECRYEELEKRQIDWREPFYDPETGDDEAALYIPWSHDDKTLLREFKKWLKQKRPHPPKHFRDLHRQRCPKIYREVNELRPRVKALRADLKALAAVRLLDRYGKWNLAASYLPAHFGRNYHRPSGWSDAQKRVEKVLAEFSV